MTKELEVYFREIENKLFTFSRKKRAACLKEHRGNVDLFFKENPDATFREMEAYFGTAEEIAESFLHEEKYADAEKKFNVKHTGVRVICVSVILALIIALVLGAVYVVDVYRFNHGHIEYSMQEGQNELPSDYYQIF